MQCWFSSWARATVPPCSVLLLDFWPAVFVPIAALFAFERVSLSVTLFPPPFSSRAFGNYNIDVVDFFLAMILHCFFSFAFLLLFLCIPHPLAQYLSLSLSVYLLQCDQVQVIPIPSVCIIIFHFSSSHHSNLSPTPPPLYLLCFIILAACGYWHKGDFSLPSNEILHSSILSDNHTASSALWYDSLSTHTIGRKKRSIYYHVIYLWLLSFVHFSCVSLITGIEHAIDFLIISNVLNLTRDNHSCSLDQQMEDPPLKLWKDLEKDYSMLMHSVVNWLLLVNQKGAWFQWSVLHLTFARKGDLSDPRFVCAETAIHLAILDSMWSCGLL